MFNMVIAYSAFSILVVSLMSLMGLFWVIKSKDGSKTITLLSSLAAGSLLGTTFFDLIPETYEMMDPHTASYIIMGSIFVFYLIEKFLWHRQIKHQGSDEFKSEHPTGWNVIIADGVHNTLDGVLITSSYMIDVKLGVVTTVGVIVHELPQEMGDFGILLKSGFSKTKALLANFASALTAFLGGLLVIATEHFGGAEALDYMIPVAAGSFLYIALSDILPDLHRDKIKYEGRELFGFISGVLFILFISLSLPHSHGHDDHDHDHHHELHHDDDHDHDDHDDHHDQSMGAIF
jgi:zinc and cadmium transporter